MKIQDLQTLYAHSPKVKSLTKAIDKYNIEHFGCTQEEIEANRLPINIMF